MEDLPWQGDACSLVDAFRAGERSPLEELEATLAAIEASELNAFAHVDPERARSTARQADLSAPFGGLPVGIKELEPVAGWPHSEASLVFRDRIADHTSVSVERLIRRGGVVPVGQTTSSEFGGLNVSVTKLHGVTRNPWRLDRTVGGSSGGSAAAVAGGLLSLATGSDGGGSIRIPAGYTGLLGFKATFGRVPRGPRAYARPNTVVVGCLARSVRDVARHLDVVAGPDLRDPTSLPDHPRFEQGLGLQDLAGRSVAFVPSLGGVRLDPGVEDHLRAELETLVAATGMRLVEVDLRLPNLAAHWMMGNMATLLAELGRRWPRCARQLTGEIAVGLHVAQALYNLHTAAMAEELRVEAQEAMADAFDQADLIVSATNPGPAFAAEATTSMGDEDVLGRLLALSPVRQALRGGLKAVQLASVAAPRLPAALIDATAKQSPDLVAMGGLTMISNLYGNPAVSIPAGTLDGLPIGLQVLAPRHADSLLLDVALAVERERPWPLVVPTVAAPTTRV